MMNKCPIIAKAWPGKERSDRRGMALLLTLLVTIILAIVVLEFNYLIRVHATLSGHFVDALKAESAARSGVEMAKAILLNDILADSDKGLMSDSFDEEWAAEIIVQTQSATAEAIISDEMAKLNLNRLLKRDANNPGVESVNKTMEGNVKRLFESLNLDPNLVDGIIDWIDKNDEDEPFGAENSYYESLDPPIGCKNGSLDSVDELMLIKDYDAEILYGVDNEPGLVDYVTVGGDKKGRVNINTATEEVLGAVLDDTVLAADIVDMREAEPFLSAQDMATRVSGVDLLKNFTTDSSFFMVSSKNRSASDSAPSREITIKAFLKRTRNDPGSDVDYFRIDTASWKVDR